MDVSLQQNQTMGKGGWQQNEITLLEDVIDDAIENGKTLREAFECAACATGRKPNSIRNFYYTYLRRRLLGENKEVVRRRNTGFDVFSEPEIRKLVEKMLICQGKGTSVRACAMDMAAGDKSMMLRYQNKYRSVIISHRTMVEEIMKELTERSITFYNPYEKKICRAENSEDELNSIKESLAKVSVELEKITERDIPQILRVIEQLVQERSRPVTEWQREAVQQSRLLNIYKQALAKLSGSVREFIFTQDYSLLGDLGKYIALAEISLDDQNLLQ